MAPKTAPAANGAKKPDHPRGPRPDRKKEEEVPVQMGPQVKTLAPVNTATAQSGKSFLDALRSGKNGARAAPAAAAPAAAAKVPTPKAATPVPEPAPVEVVPEPVPEPAPVEVVAEPVPEPEEPEVVVSVTAAAAAAVAEDEPVVSAPVMTLQNPAQIDWGATEEELKFGAQPMKPKFHVQYPEKVLENRPNKAIQFSAPTGDKDLSNAFESLKRDRQHLEAKVREFEEMRKEQAVQFEQKQNELIRRERAIIAESEKLHVEREALARQQQQQQQQQHQQPASFSGASSPQPAQQSPQSMMPQQAPHQARGFPYPPNQGSYAQEWAPQQQDQRAWAMDQGAQGVYGGHSNGGYEYSTMGGGFNGGRGGGNYYPNNRGYMQQANQPVMGAAPTARRPEYRGGRGGGAPFQAQPQQGYPQYSQRPNYQGNFN